MASTQQQTTAQAQSRRAHYRIIYPLRGRPALRAGEASYAVVNLSESGAQVVCDSASELAVQAPVKGTITFADASEVEIQGTVLRHDGRRAVIKFSRRVPLRIIMEQQRQLIQKSST